ncbi:MAG: carboxypeptidase-like regulatory domain-containing protein [Aigarchaeota archaeon]|nr:carboxypeptidase-like regulatory domain-containing protein [Aigarchaeota archaeon]MDW8092399.1 carboxypeptidase-like regulatory domain-containing protein [Nitrososphaerota archaeon]
MSREGIYRALTLLTLVAAAVLVFSLNLNDADATIMTIRVVDFDGDTIIGANVTMTNSTKVFSDLTDSNGRVIFTNVRLTLNYTMTVYFKGIAVYNLERWNYTIHGGNLVVSVFKPLICVRSSGGLDPVRGATVRVSSTITEPDTNEERTTDSGGCARFPQLPRTNYVINASYVSFGTKVERVDAVEISSTNYQLTLDLQLFRMTLRFRDQDNLAVRNVETRLWRGSILGDPQASLLSAENGEVVFRLLPTGSYNVQARYRDDLVYETGGTPITITTANVERTITLPLRELVLSLKTLSGRPLSGFTVHVRVYAGGVEYASGTTSSSTLSLGLFFTGRSYSYDVRFEGAQIGSGTIPREGIGNHEVVINVGTFTIRIDDSEVLERLRPVLIGANIEISVGSYVTSLQFDREKRAVFDERPLVRYRYRITVSTYEMRAGEVHPTTHQQVIPVKPIVGFLNVTASSLEGRGLRGIITLTALNTVDLGRFEVGEGGTRISGLLRLDYGYQFRYKGIDVASGRASSDLLNSTLRVSTRVGDVGIMVFNFKGDKVLQAAIVRVNVGEYSEFKLSDREGRVTFPDVPLTSVQVTVSYKGVKVYANSHPVSPGNRQIVISETGVYDISLRLIDGEGQPLNQGLVRVSVGPDYRESKEIRAHGLVSLELIPNGTMTASVEYLGVNVFEGSRRIAVDGEVIEIKTEVYTMRVSVLKQGSNRLLPLSDARVVFVTRGQEVYRDTTRDGFVTVKLPASEYGVRVEFLKTVVGNRAVSHTRPSFVEIKADVYETTLRFLNLDGTPMANERIIITLNNEPLLEAVTDSEGRIVTFLSKNTYVSFPATDRTQRYPIAVSEVTSQSFIYISPSEGWRNLLITSVAIGLFAVSALSLYKSLPPRRPAPTQPTRTEPVRRETKKKNI